MPAHTSDAARACTAGETAIRLRTLALGPLAAAYLGLGLGELTQAAEPEIVARARAAIGAEKALTGLISIRLTGSLTVPDPVDPAKATTQSLEVIFQRPYQQRIHVKSPTTEEITCLDGDKAWSRVQEAGNPVRGNTTWLNAEQVRRMRANTWENLNYFRGLEAAGGTLQDLGPANVEGRACRKLAFVHGPDLVFYRYFDSASGRLVLTETESGTAIREESEIFAGGIRFPHRVVNVTQDQKGRRQTQTITFERITVNETMPAGLFTPPAEPAVASTPRGAADNPGRPSPSGPAKVGSKVTLQGSADGSPPPTFQWLKDGIELPGETNATLVIPSVGPQHAGKYSLRATNKAGSATSPPTVLVVEP